MLILRDISSVANRNNFFKKKMQNFINSVRPRLYFSFYFEVNMINTEEIEMLSS